MEAKTLIELTNESRDLVTILMQNGGELTPELEKELQDVTYSLTHKVDSYFEIISRAENESRYWKQREMEAAGIRKACENVVVRLRSYIKAGLITLQKQSVEGNFNRFFLRKSKASLKIINESEIPPMYFEETVVRTLNKEKLRYDMENGILISGAILEESYSLNDAPVKKYLKGD